MRSLQGLLVLTCALTVAAVEVVAGRVLYAQVERSLTGELDRTLASEAQVLASLVEQEGQRVELEFQEDLDPRLYADAERGVFLRVWRGDEALYSSPELHGSPLLDGAQRDPAPRWLPLPAGGRVRVTVLAFRPRVEHRGRDPETAPLTLALTRGGAELDVFLANLRSQLVLVGGVALLVVIAALWLAIRIGLRPLRAIRDAIAGVQPSDLETRLPVERAPLELRPVVEQLNAFLERLQGAFLRERSFSSDVAHELRTPLAAARAALEITREGESTAADYRASQEQALQVLGSLSDLVERLFQLTRLEGGLAFPERACVDLADVALECWEGYLHRAQTRELAVEWDVSGDPVCWANRELLTVLLRNLFDNATGYADLGGRIEVRLSGDATRGVVLAVENSGSQVPADEVERVTRRFWRGDRARTAAAEHGGLGLALVARVAAALDAELAIESELGGTFRVTLRLPPAPQCA